MRQYHYVDRRVVELERIEQEPEASRARPTINDHLARTVGDQSRVALADVEDFHDELRGRSSAGVTGWRRRGRRSHVAVVHLAGRSLVALAEQRSLRAPVASLDVEVVAERIRHASGGA